MLCEVSAASSNVPKPCCVLLVPNVLKMTQAAQTVTRKAIPLDQEPVISNQRQQPRKSVGGSLCEGCPSFKRPLLGVWSACI